jgi:hypothetical protein
MSLSISDKNTPNPTTLTTLTLAIRGVKNNSGQYYDFSTASKVYATIKDSLADTDATANVVINSVSNPTQFVLTYANNGNMDITFNTTNTALTAGTLYYLDIKAVWTAGAAVEIVRDTLVFDTPVTLAVS